ncbi:unnamed protein product [Diplocarpon coronariae]|nr:hypothetical protein JHW43_002832 [Diplocarpon mali]
MPAAISSHVSLVSRGWIEKPGRRATRRAVYGRYGYGGLSRAGFRGSTEGNVEEKPTLRGDDCALLTHESARIARMLQDPGESSGWRCGPRRGAVYSPSTRLPQPVTIPRSHGQLARQGTQLPNPDSSSARVAKPPISVPREKHASGLPGHEQADIRTDPANKARSGLGLCSH